MRVSDRRAARAKLLLRPRASAERLDRPFLSRARAASGSAIAAALRARGHDIRVLARPSSPRTNLNLADTLCEGDLRDRASLAAALKGARYLFHAAADYRLWARDPEEIPEQSRGHASHHGGGA